MYLFRKDGRYYIAVKTDGRWQRRSTGFSTQAEAKKVFRRVSNRVADGLPPFEEVKERPGDSFSQFCEEYVEKKEDQGYDVERDTHAIAHLQGSLPVRLSAITRESIEEYIGQRLKSGAKPATVWTEIRILKTILNRAVDWKRLSENPARRVTVHRGTTPRKRLLSKYEIGTLIDSAGTVSEVLRDLVETALLTGMRRGELLKLKERDCNLVRKEIRIPESKTGEGRVVPMHPIVVEILSRRGLWHPENADARLFPLANVPRPFQAAVRKAGLKDLRFHDLRRLAISYLAMNGVDLKTTMTLVGHRDPRMTMMVYAMVSDDHLQDAIAKLDFGTHTEHEMQMDGNGSGVVVLGK